MIVHEEIKNFGVLTMSEDTFDETLREAFKMGYQDGYLDNNMLEASRVGEKFDEWYSDKYKWKFVDEDGTQIGENKLIKKTW